METDIKDTDSLLIILLPEPNVTVLDHVIYKQNFLRTLGKHKLHL